ncbi:MAG: hypothetical protein JW892_00895, partial [Anaerolineae bacterium]|nr:hypothetical protein [Anaerolineae bacterium]
TRTVRASDVLTEGRLWQAMNGLPPVSRRYGGEAKTLDSGFLGHEFHEFPQTGGEVETQIKANCNEGGRGWDAD